MTDVQAPADGALSIDDAVNQLDGPAEEGQAGPEPQEVEAEAEGEVEAEAEADADAEDLTGEEPEAPAAEAPHYWTAEEKARFAELPPELQAVVARNEADRERAVQKAQREAVEARKAAEAEAASIKGFAEQIGSVVERAKAQHSRVVPELGMTWEQVDWPAWFQQDRETAAAFRAQYDAEREDLQRLEASRQQTQAVAFQQFLQAESAKLPELCPDLVDPTEGPRRKAAVAQFLGERGVPQDQLAGIDAVSLSIAYDAMRWRDAQAKAQARPQPRPPAVRPVRPAAPAQTSTPQRQADQARNRFAQTRSVDDAVALLNLRG
jgi:hypothetical protein